MGSWLLGGVAVVMLVAGVQTWRIDNLKKKEETDTLRVEKIIAEGNFATCQRTNKTNKAVIERQRNSIREFMLAQDEALARNELLAEELAERQLAAREESREVRNEVREVLSAEACASVEHPPRVHKLLNDAIAKASVDGG